MAVRVRGQILYIDFYTYLPGGRRTRCVESTGLKDTGKNRKIVEEKDKAIKYHLKNGTFKYLDFFPEGSKSGYFRKPQASILFADWWEEWLKEKSIRINTAKGWNSAYRVHIGPYFGARNAFEIDDHEVLIFRKHLEDKGLMPSTINRVVKALCMSLYRLYKRYKMAGYPCEEIRQLAEGTVDIHPYTFEELEHFLSKLKTKRPVFHDMVFLWSRTGLRPGELCALKWTRIDYFNKKALIRETKYNSTSEGPPKTQHSNRDVDLRPAVIDALKRQQGRTGLQEYVFITEAGKPFTVEFLRKKFRFLCQLADLPYRSPKQMRHTFATLHLAAGENIGWVSKQLGHASPKVTWDRYYRFIPNLTRDDGSAFEAVFQGQKGSNIVTEDSKVLI